MSLKFNDISVNDYFIAFNGITYQKITESGRNCCIRGVNSLSINTGSGGGASFPNQFFAERLVIAHAGFSDNYSDSDTGVQFYGEPFNDGANLLNVSGFLYIGQDDGIDGGVDVFRHNRVQSDIDDIAIKGGIAYVTLTGGGSRLDIDNTANRTGDFITTAVFKFPSSDLNSGDLHAIRFAASFGFDGLHSYFGCRINGRGGLGIEYGTHTGVIELSENYLTSYSGQSVYLSCNYNYNTKIANITAQSNNMAPASVMSNIDANANASLDYIMAFAPADNNVGLKYWQTMITPQ